MRGQLNTMVRLGRFSGTLAVFVFLLYVVQTFLPGPTISPFLRFGMFSEKQEPTDSLQVIQLSVNGQLLNPTMFSIHAWDNLTGPFYQRYHENSQSFLPLQIRQKMIDKFQLDSSRWPKEKFLTTRNDALFLQTALQQIERITQQPVSSLEVSFQSYRFQDSLIPLGQAKPFLRYERGK